MGSTIGYGILFLFGGTLLAAVWSLLIGFGGAPGAVLSYKLRPDKNRHDGPRNLSVVGLAACVVGQSYVALALCALVVGFTTNLLQKRTDLIGWIIWTIAFWVACAPAFYNAKEASTKNEEKTQDIASTFTLILSPIGFLLFVFAPSIMKVGWGWMPYVD